MFASASNMIVYDYLALNFHKKTSRIHVLSSPCCQINILVCSGGHTQSTVLPVPTRHRRHACIKMRTALPANTKTRLMLFQCWTSAVGGGPILKQHWVKCSHLLGSTQVSVYTHPSATIIFSPADQGTFSKTAGQSQAYYNTWNWERGTYDVNHLHILPCQGAVSRVSSVWGPGYSKLFYAQPWRTCFQRVIKQFVTTTQLLNSPVGHEWTLIPDYI